MCGIVGYVGGAGATDAAEFLLEGLRRLEYRGYDSAGIGTISADGAFCITKTPGRIETLAQAMTATPAVGRIGIGHTRWATHGPATQHNAHPHLDHAQQIAVVHNGVIENYRQLRERLQQHGHKFISDTDSEVIAHLIGYCLRELEAENPTRSKPHSREDLLLHAVLDTLMQLQGTYGLVVLFRDHPDVMIAARLGSPLVVGVGDGEHFVASDASPLVGYTDKIVYLADHQVARDHRRAAAGHASRAGSSPARTSSRWRWTPADVELDGFPHYMLKEIFEQPESLRERDARSLERRGCDGRLRRPEPVARSNCGASTGSC